MDYSFKMLPMVRITHCGHQSDNPVIISISLMGKNMRPADSALDLSVSSFSWCLGRAAVCDCGIFFFLVGDGGGRG